MLTGSKHRLHVLAEVEGIDLYGLGESGGRRGSWFGSGKANLAKIDQRDLDDGAIGSGCLGGTIERHRGVLRGVLIACKKGVGGIVLQVLAEAGAAILDLCGACLVDGDVPKAKRAIERRGVLIPRGEAILGLAAVGN